MLLDRLDMNRMCHRLCAINGIESVACHRITGNLVISNGHSESVVKTALKVIISTRKNL
jgi:hypothetical protein